MDQVIRIRKQSAFVILLALLGIGCARALVSMAPPTLPTVPDSALRLDSHAFPTRWEVDLCDEKDCIRKDGAYRVFGIPGVPGHVIQEVTRFPSESSAHSYYQAVREVAFKRSKQTSRQPSTDFVPPSEITYRSPIADEAYLGCGLDVVPGCQYIVRYRNYYVEFYFDIDGGKRDGLKIQEVEPNLRAMDEKASSALGIPIPTRTP